MNFCRAILFALATVAVTACGGGGGSNPTPQAGLAPVSQAPVDQTGVVGILIKDAPTGDFTRIVMRITAVELLGDDDPVVIFDGDKEFDLLELQNFYDMLAVSETVPVGEYSKIRLRVRSITLYCLDASGDEISVAADVPANGKVDLNPRGSFTVAADNAILIEIDLDANKSIHVVGTGNNRYKFRPVVFVDIQETQALQGLIRASGEVGEIDRVAGTFDLCNVDTQFQTDTNGCVQVNLLDDTRIFAADGEEVDFENLMSGDPVTVYGLVIITGGDDDDDGDSDDSNDDADDDDTVRMVQINAVVIQKGDPQAILSLDGTVLSPVDGDRLFSFEVAPGQDFPTDPLDVLVQTGTRILSADDLSELDASALETGRFAEVIGVQRDGEPELLRASLILVEIAEGSRDSLSGEITALDSETFTLFVADGDPAGDRCIAPVSDAHYLVINESEDDGTLVDDASAADLAVGQTVSVYGEESDVAGCFTAEDIIIIVTEDT